MSEPRNGADSDAPDLALEELNWAIHAKNHARSRLALNLLTKIIREDDATRDDIVFQAYLHKFDLEMEFLTFRAARATAIQMITRFHGMYKPYQLKARADIQLYKLEEALLATYVGLSYHPIHQALISELNLLRRRLCRTITSASARKDMDQTDEPFPPYDTDVVNVPDCFVRVQGVRMVPTRLELCDGLSQDQVRRVKAVEPHGTQLLLGKNVEPPAVLLDSAAQAPRMANLAQLCMPVAFLEGFYEPSADNQASLFDRDCGIILSRAVRKLESVPVPPDSIFIFDVDDTAVTSYWYMKQRAFQSIPPTEFYYYSRYKAPAIPLLFKFYTYLLWKGIKVVFLSERPEVVREQTLAVLKAAGYAVDSSNLLMRSPKEQMLSVSILKQRMRTKLHREKQCKIVGCIGDQFCDITGEFTGSPFKIPNYMYHLE
ncbi:hypothetical protein Ae201684P_000468 [Aphanomyces euteiches]|uniref:Uncharacterized protein n=1 Tax=Aphanomyces euteiches TaxID=100861 RepID=A0A6G0XRC1_9STRA|nr:hypothetical protein Ae201684_002249 [Aphanomyces euteiches]KAH9087055.1 hypothetical protein Ae201684P_000468 [Aphanomyces euteiches]KAH9142639.1 hypothetical protein AeRB84_013286 [Aphanomyces euteiches]